MDSWVSPVRQARHYIFLLKSGENGNLHLFFPFFYRITTGGHLAQSETTKVPSRDKAELRVKQRNLAAPFWAVRAQQGGSSEICPAFSRPRAVWQLLRLWGFKRRWTAFSRPRAAERVLLFFPYAPFCARLSKSVEIFSFCFPFYPLLFLYLCYKM